MQAWRPWVAVFVSTSDLGGAGGDPVLALPAAFQIAASAGWPHFTTAARVDGVEGTWFFSRWPAAEGGA